MTVGATFHPYGFFRGFAEVGGRPRTARELQNLLSMLRDTCPDFGVGAEGELWRVRLPTGERTLTIEELDAAFDADLIDTNTLVCPPGGTAFARLGAIAGLDPAPVAMAPLPQQAPTFRTRTPSLDLGSVASFRPRWSLPKLLVVPAALAILGVIAFAARASTPSDASASLPEARTEVAASPAAPVADAKPAASGTPTVLLSDAQKKALAAKDKKAEAAKNAKRAAVAPKRSFAPSKSASPFSKGGSAHDPLNGAL